MNELNRVVRGLDQRRKTGVREEKEERKKEGKKLVFF